MKLPKDQLALYRTATDKRKAAETAFTDAALKRHMAVSAEEYHTRTFLEANKALNELSEPIVAEHGKDVKINLETGEILNSTKNA